MIGRIFVRIILIEIPQTTDKNINNNFVDIV